MFLTTKEIETIIAFIKSLKQNEIPSDVWKLCMKISDEREESPCDDCQEWDCEGCKYMCTKMSKEKEESPCDNCQEWDCDGCKYKKGK